MSNVEIGVECQIFFLLSFLTGSEFYNLGAHSRYYKGAITILVMCTTFRSDFCVG